MIAGELVCSDLHLVKCQPGRELGPRPFVAWRNLWREELRRLETRPVTSSSPAFELRDGDGGVVDNKGASDNKPRALRSHGGLDGGLPQTTSPYSTRGSGQTDRQNCLFPILSASPDLDASQRWARRHPETARGGETWTWPRRGHGMGHG